MANYSKSLPIWAFAQAILQTIFENRVTIIQAQTGSGKSTQLPLMILEDTRFESYEVIITQPRTLQTLSIAQYVADSLGELPGSTIGYKTRTEKTEGNCRITYMTDGYLCSTFPKSPGRKIIIIDECHEQNINMDQIMAFCKNAMKFDEEFKVVIMSATMNSSRLSEFFYNAPVIDVPGTMHNVEWFHEPQLSLCECILKYFKPGMNALVFLPGKEDIEIEKSRLLGIFRKRNIVNPPEVFELHSDMTFYEQEKVFPEFENGKIIFCTNVAETGISIPGINLVIDSGKVKQEYAYGDATLEVVNTSQFSCIQRAGRAGRFTNGIYVLCSTESFESREISNRPAIQCDNLDRFFLHLAKKGFKPEDLEFVNSPSQILLDQAKKLLLHFGAIDESGIITEVGIELEAIPVSSTRIAKMIFESKRYSSDVQGDIMLIASIMECGSFINKNFNICKYPVYFKDAFRSDLTFLMVLFKDIYKYWNCKSINHRTQYLRSANIRAQTFQKIVSVLQYLTKYCRVPNPLYQGTYHSNFFKLRCCITAGHTDQIYIFEKRDRNKRIRYRPITEPEGIESFYYTELTSGLTHPENCFSIPTLAVGTPFKIHVEKSSSIGNHYLPLLTNASEFTLPDNIDDALDFFARIPGVYCKQQFDSKKHVFHIRWYIQGVELYKGTYDMPQAPLCTA